MDPTASGRPRARGGGWGDIVTRYAVAWVLVGLIIGFWIALPDTFGQWRTVQTLLVTQTVAGILALAVIFPLVIGEFDLSIGMIAGFTALIVAYLNGPGHWNTAGTLAVGLLVGPTLGLINGLLISQLHIDALIATLAVATLLQGSAIAVSTNNVATDPNRKLTSWAQTMILGQIPVTAIYLLAVALTVWFLIDVTAWGRYLRVVGANRRSALLIGLPVARLRLTAFVVAGLLAGVAGVVNTMQIGSASQSDGAPLLLPAYAAAFVGATTIKPGRFNVLGTLLAVFLLAVGITGIQLLGGPEWVQYIFNGTALVVAVVLPSRFRRTFPA